MGNNRRVSLTVLLLLTGGIASCNPSSQRGVSDTAFAAKEVLVSCTIEIKRNRTAIDAVVIFKNPTDQPIALYKPNLFVDGVTFSAFSITHDGGRVPYRGSLVKRGPPSLEDWQLLEPGASHEVKVRISDYYDLTASGEYEVYYSVRYGLPADHLARIQSNKVKLEVP
jgi:hypothetical protein